MSKYNAEIGCFTMAPDAIVNELGLVTACVYGKIWRYEQMSNEVCRAAIETLANDLGVSYNTVLSHIKKLLDSGYIKDLTPELRNRPHIYKTTGRLKLEINIVSTHQFLDTTNQNLDSHSSKIGDESDSLRDKLIDNKANDDAKEIGKCSYLEADQLFREVTKLISMPNSERRVIDIETICKMVDTLGRDEAKKRMESAWVWWLAKRTKDGRKYSKTNTAWIDYAMTGENVTAKTVVKSTERRPSGV